MLMLTRTRMANKKKYLGLQTAPPEWVNRDVIQLGEGLKTKYHSPIVVGQGPDEK